MIDQVKGFSYSATSLLGESSFLLKDRNKCSGETENQESVTSVEDGGKRSWWRISFASPKALPPRVTWYISDFSSMFHLPFFEFLLIMMSIIANQEMYFYKKTVTEDQEAEQYSKSFLT